MSLWGEQHLWNTNWTLLLGSCLTITATHIQHTWIYKKKKNLQPTCGVHLFVSTHLERDPRSRLIQRKRCKIMDSYFFKHILESFCSDSCKISKENVKRQKFFSDNFQCGLRFIFDLSNAQVCLPHWIQESTIPLCFINCCRGSLLSDRTDSGVLDPPAVPLDPHKASLSY